MPQPSSARSRFSDIVDLIGKGEFVQANQLCLEMLHEHPQDVNVLGLRGAVLIKLHRLAEAEQVLRETMRIAPNFAKPHEDLGFVLLERGRAQEAAEVLQNAVRLDPSLDFAHFNLGKALAATGRGKEADAAFEKSFELNPERRKTALAAEMHKDGKLEEAERLYQEVLRENPLNVDAMRLLGRVALSAKRNTDAERLFRRAVNITPGFAGAWMDLGRVLKEQDDLEEAAQCFRRVLELQPRNPRAYVLLAASLASMARTFDAIEAYKTALDIDAHHPGAMLGLGHVLKTVGRQDEAIDAYRSCIRAKQDNGESYWSLANLKTYRLDDDDIAAMQSSIEKDELTIQSRVNFLFALAKAFEDRADYARAWQFYQEGNSTQRLHESYDPVQTETINDHIIEVFDEEYLRQHAGIGEQDGSPIFVLGLPRSGSTLIEQILASHSKVEGTSELPYLGRVATSLNRNRSDGINYPEAVRELSAEHFVQLGKDYLALANRHRTQGAERFIDKMPNNFPAIGFLNLILPNASIVDARRHPLDACLGCYRQLFAKGQAFTYDLTDIGEYYLQYERMIDHWQQVLPGKVLTVQYEQLVSDFDKQVHRLLAHCGLPFEDNCLRFYETERPVRTASSEQVRQPIYTTSVGFWRNYEQELSELIEILQPSLQRYEAFMQ